MKKQMMIFVGRVNVSTGTLNSPQAVENQAGPDRLSNPADDF